MKKLLLILILILSFYWCEQNPIGFENQDSSLIEININYDFCSDFINYSVFNNSNIEIESFNIELKIIYGIKSNLNGLKKKPTTGIETIKNHCKIKPGQLYESIYFLSNPEQVILSAVIIDYSITRYYN